MYNTVGGCGATNKLINGEMQSEVSIAWSMQMADLPEWGRVLAVSRGGFGKGESAGPAGGVRHKVWQRCTRESLILGAKDYLWEKDKDVEERAKWM